jgi:hypothetical protein
MDTTNRPQKWRRRKEGKGDLATNSIALQTVTRPVESSARNFSKPDGNDYSSALA